MFHINVRQTTFKMFIIYLPMDDVSLEEVRNVSRACVALSIYVLSVDGW